MTTMTERTWSLESAQAILPDVRKCTERTVTLVERLFEDLRIAADPTERQSLEAKLQGELSRWAREIEALGAQVGEGWSVRFEAGAGAFSWQWPEPALAFFDSRDHGRIRIH